MAKRSVYYDPSGETHQNVAVDAWTPGSARRYRFGVAKRSRKHIVVGAAVAALAVVGGSVALKRRMYTAVCGSSESTTVAYLIRAAEEAYLAENEHYLDVSTSNTLYPGPGATRMAFDNPQHPDSARWKLLNVIPDGPVRCGYAVRAGDAGEALPAEFPGAPPRPAGKKTPWYVARVMCTSPEGTKEIWVASWTQERWENTSPAPITTPSCPTASSAAPPTEAPSSAAPLLRRRHHHQPLMVARYACDEKYDEKNCEPGSETFQRWLSGVDLDKGENLLELKGGGPVGGQWNPNAPLVLFVQAPLDEGKPSLRVGHHQLRPTTTHGDHLIYYVPQSTWERSGRRPRSDELTEVDQSQRVAVTVTDIACKYSDGRNVKRLFVWANGE